MGKAKIRAKIKPSELTQVEKAETQIWEYSRTARYTVMEYSCGFLVQKLKAGDHYVPDYQRELAWTPMEQSRFIESVLMDLPLPLIVFWQGDKGGFEIVDGSQRIRTVRDFMDDKIVLCDLEILSASNGLRYSDFSDIRQRRFASKSMRAIVLDNSADPVVRTELFARINTGGTVASNAEVRRGNLPGLFMDMVASLAESPEFVALTPMSRQQVDGREREELVTRFFAYLENFDPKVVASDNKYGDLCGYEDDSRQFYSSFVQKMNDRIAAEIEPRRKCTSRDVMCEEFHRMLRFVAASSPDGFRASSTVKKVSRVRFEAIAVGSALALRADPGLAERVPDLAPLLESEEFRSVTGPANANVKSNLLRRIRLVKNWLADK